MKVLSSPETDMLLMLSAYTHLLTAYHPSTKPSRRQYLDFVLSYIRHHSRRLLYWQGLRPLSITQGVCIPVRYLGNRAIDRIYKRMLRAELDSHIHIELVLYVHT